MMRQQENWVQLPGNLWAAIFSTAGRTTRFHAPYQYQSWLFRLRIVCQAFNIIFKQYGDLHTVVHLRKTPGRHLLSLLQWLQHHQAQVKHLDVAYDSPWREMALMALQSPHACLEKVHFHKDVPEAALLLLSTFQSIKQCVLHSSEAQLDLQPLLGLPQLADLDLQEGYYCNLEAAAHLTALSLDYATAFCAQDSCCVTSLVHLKLSSASLMHFHRSNVAACSHLQSLSLCKGYIGANDDEVAFAFEDEEVTIPSGLSALTALTSLRLHYPNCNMNLDWVTALSALQSFQLEASQAVFPASWSAMTCLKTLNLDADGFDYDQPYEEPNVQFQFDWSVLVSLEVLDLQCLSMRDIRLSSLVSLHNLQRICFGQLENINVDTTKEIALFAFDLGRNRPDVEFSMPFEGW